MHTIKGEVRTIKGKRIASPEYRSWQMMKNRCLNPKATDWKYYGGRGIKISRRWLVYDGFIKDMGRKPTMTHTIERIDSNGNYTKRNCYWATRTEQARNRDYVALTMASARQIRFLYRGGQLVQNDLAKMFGVSQVTISLIIRGKIWKEVARCTS